MNIILEGTDGTGKSTTIQNLLNYFTGENEKLFTVIYNTGVKMEDEYRYDYMIQTYKNMWKTCRKLDHIIFDRSHISESVYAEMYRGQNTDELFKVEMKAPEDTYLIMLTDNIENLLKKEDGLSLSKNRDSKMKELSLFNDSFRRSNLKKMKIDISQNTEEQVIKKIIKFIKENK